MDQEDSREDDVLREPTDSGELTDAQKAEDESANVADGSEESNEKQSDTVWLVLLQQISAVGLGAVGLVYGVGMLTYTGQAEALGIPKMSAYSYLSLDMILTRGLGVLFIPWFAVLVLLLLFVGWFIWSLAKEPAGPPMKRPTWESSKAFLKGSWIMVTGWILGTIFLFPWWFNPVIATILGVFGSLLWLRRQISEKYRPPVMATLVVGLVLVAGFVSLNTRRPDLARVDLTVRSGTETKLERAELWLRTDEAWVLVKGSELIDIPTDQVTYARIERAPEEQTDDQDSDPTLFELGKKALGH